jgi:hypothetical protein
MTNILTKETKKFLQNKRHSLENILTETMITKPNESENSTKKKLAEFFTYTIKPYYENQNFFINPAVFNLILEAFKNSYYHGGNYKPHTSIIKIFLSPTTLLSKHNDEGNYFKRKEIKEHWEDKKFFPEKHKIKNNQTGFGIGIPLIYDVSDFIQVETKTGSLYLGVSTVGINFKKF